jgi:hypothetical protein
LWPQLRQRFPVAAGPRRQGPAVAEVTTDPQADAIDDESCYTVTGYTP